MKLVEYCPSQVRGKLPSSSPAIGINFRVGAFQFYRSANPLLGLAAGKQVRIFKDEENPEDWYIEVVETGGFELKPHKKGAFRFNAAAIAKEIREITGFKDIYGAILIAGKPTKIGKRTLNGLIISRLKTHF